jgi:hypothetical protein
MSADAAGTSAHATLHICPRPDSAGGMAFPEVREKSGLVPIAVGAQSETKCLPEQNPERKRGLLLPD